MRAKIARHSVGAIFFMLALALLPHFIGPDPAMAESSFLTAFNNLYRPGGVGSATGVNAQCALCHFDRLNGGGDVNGYGKDWAMQPHGTSTARTAAFQAIESLNSDNASANNLAEINASAQPGWTSGQNQMYDNRAFTTTTTTAAPAAIGTLDPAANQPPVANAGANQAVNVGQTVQLNGSASTDPEGQLLTYSWTLPTRPVGSGAALTNPTTVNPTFTPDAAGVYIAQLVVNDGTQNSAPASVTITATPAQNLPPVANAGPDQAVNVGQTVTLNGSGSSDPNANPLTYAWSFVSRPAGSAAALSNVAAVQPTFVADVAGNYTVQLIVNDGQANSPPDAVIIAAATGNLPPVANAGLDQAVTVATTVTLDGSASSDPEGHALTYSWFFVSQPAGSPTVLENPTTAKPTFTPVLPGSYVVGLVVNDGILNSTQTNVVITVQSFSSDGCFIATAAFGSPLAPQVQLLRAIRDTYLLPYEPGRVLVQWYYAVSPAIADFIGRSETLRAVVRVALMPLLGWAMLALWSPAIGLGVPLLPIVGVWLAVRRSRQR